MNQSRKGPSGRRYGKGSYTTRSGKIIRLHQSLTDRLRASKQARDIKHATYLSTLPKNPFLRALYRLHPRRLAQYWFSREGAIMGLKIVGVGIVVVFLLTIGVFAYFRKDLPQIKDISGGNLPGSITYYDRTGQTVLWQDYDVIRRIQVPSDQISGYMKKATVAIEDKNFYHEGAFNIGAIARAGLHDFTGGGGGGLQGASTITQQLVKLNENWTDNRTITRKVKELILAVELGREYSKDDILTGYLNIAPYGGVEYGVESAARDYFGISAKDLSLAQAAMLAAIPQSPTLYSPYGSTQFNPAAGNTFNEADLIGRQQYILDQMVAQHMITKQQADDAKKENVLAEVHPLSSKYQGIKAPYFVLAAKQELEQKYGSETVKQGGWKVTTTLDLSLQNTAEQLIASNLPNIQRLTHGRADEEASVTEDVPTGQIVALVGGTNFSDPDHGQNNYAASVLIPPGSSFKPYDYTTLIDNNNNVGASSVIYDEDTPLPANGYECTNHALPKNGGNCLKDYDFLQPGAITLRYALGGSRNVPAVKSMLSAVPNDTSYQKVTSINKVVSTATAMMDNPYIKGNAYNCYADDFNTKPTQCYASSAIGDGAFLHLDDHVNGLATLGRLGAAIPRTFILQIDDSNGKSIYKWSQPQGTQVIKQDAAYIVDNMASDPNASYLPGSCTATNCTKLSSFGYKFHRDNGSTFAIKTGTTNSGFDGLMTSWSSKYAVVSWVGNHDRSIDISLNGAVPMETLTEPLTRGMMEAAQVGKSPATWTQPSDIKVEPVFVQRNHVNHGDIEPGPSTDLFPSWYVGGTNKGDSSQIVDKVSGKVATSCTPTLAKDVQQNGNAALWNVDIFKGGKTSISSASDVSNAPQATDDVHNCGDNQPSVTITAPSTCDANSGGCTVTVTATQGTHPLSGGSYTTAPAGTLSVQLGSQTIGTANIPSDSSDVYTYTFTYTPTSTQTASLTATVVDSVLYSSTNTTSPIDFTQGAQTQGLTFGSATSNGSTTTISWTGGTGPYTVYKGALPVSSDCTATSSTSCTASSASLPPGTHITVKDSAGNSTSGST